MCTRASSYVVLGSFVTVNLFIAVVINNLDEVLDAVTGAGHKVVWPRREVRPGVVIAMVEDPDGNWVEFIQSA